MISFLLIIVSLLVFNWHVGNIKERENLKRDGVKISALVVTRTEIEYPTPEGKVRVKPEVLPTQGTLERFTNVTAYYDRNDVRKVIIDQDDSAYNITLYVVCAKLFGVGLIFLYLGLRRLKKYSI